MKTQKSKIKNQSSESSEKRAYIPSEIEAKWQNFWSEDKTFSPDMNEAKKPFYNLMMFPYPSAEGLHVGNMYAFTGADVYARFKRMQGYAVFEPIGLDGFGIHSENYALKIGAHPMDQAKKSEKNFYRQLHSIGNSFDWERTVETYDPDYYRWTQFIFIQMFKAGLAYRKAAEVNWCPSCKTVLSDEQVIAGACERCGSTVEKRNLEQWFFKITDYAERLLKNLEILDWTEKVKIAQKNWIGRSEGALITFAVDDLDCKINVFTTRPDTLFGATFLVVAPEHALVEEVLTSQFIVHSKKENDTEREPSDIENSSRFTVHSSQLQKIKEYVDMAKAKTDQDRTAEGKEKTGVFSGLYAINPVNGEKIPVWIADYVLGGYGTGAIMAVPAHDQRDFEFALKYELPIVQVVEGNQPSSQLIEAYIGSGTLINSKDWNRTRVPEEKHKIIDDLKKKKIGKKETNYHLRDWLISRQRYWGAPIPMIYCESCAEKGKSWFTSEENSEFKVQNSKLIHKSEFSNLNSSMAGWYPVPDDQLPVMLPYIQDYKPLGTGKAPLASHEEFYKTVCPECGSSAVRETDVSDTFLDSAWYFLRYPSTDIENEAFDQARTKKWLPVDQYIGGAEHSVLHLLYSRFVTMVLHDLKLVDFDEPFTKFFAHGLIIKDGVKMSKSKGNVVVPDEYISKYGTDALRSYLMFLGQFSQGGDFRDTGMEGMFRFTRRLWTLFHSVHLTDTEDPDVEKMLHKTIKAVTEDISTFSYNTSIARLMELYNFVSLRDSLSRSTLQSFLKILAPFMPHMAEEIWQEIHDSRFTIQETSDVKFNSIHLSPWPDYDSSLLIEDSVIIPIQVNGKRRGEVTVQRAALKDQTIVEKEAREMISTYLDGQQVKNIVYVPGKIINFVI